MTPALHSSPASGIGRKHEIVFIDTAIENYRYLAEGVAAGVEIVLLDRSADGLGQIAQHLAGRSGIDAVHVLSHGSDGLLALGSASIGSDALAGYGAELATIRQALSEDADFLLYGCDVAASAAGVAFVGRLAAATGADVAASDDMTGAGAKGGDWQLEVATGTVESALPIDPDRLAGFSGVLLSEAVTVDFSGAPGGMRSYVMDGEFGSVDIPNFNLRFRLGDAIGAPVDDIVYFDSEPGWFEGLTGAAGYEMLVVESSDGKSFDFNGFTASDWAGGSGSLTIEGFLSTNSTGPAVTLNLGPGATQSFGASNFPDAQFGKVTQVRISGNWGDGQTYATFDKFQIAPPPSTAPTLSASGASRSFTEDGSATLPLFTGADARVVDAGQHFTSLRLTVTNVQAGDMLVIDGTPVALGSGPGGSAAGGNYFVTMAGSTATVILTGLALGDHGMNLLIQGISFDSSSQNPGNADRVVTITSVGDNGSTNNTAATNIAATVSVTPANDAPTASNLSNFRSFTEDGGAMALNDIVVADPDGGDTVTATLTLSDATAGALSTGTYGSATSTYDAGTGTWTVAGSVADVNAALAAVAFSPAANRDTGFTISTRVRDAAGTGPADGTITVSATPANDAPTATNLTQSASFTEDAGAGLGFDPIVVTDIDAGATVTASLTLSQPAAGTLSTGSFGSASSSYHAGTGVWTVTGSTIDVNAALAAVRFSPAPNWDQNLAIATRVRDAAGTGPADGTISLGTTGVQDAPLASNLDQSKSFGEDPGAPVALDDIQVSDADTGETITATLTLSHPAAGSLSTGTYGSATSTFNAGTGAWTVVGGVADVNAALAAVSFNAAPNWDQNLNIATRIVDAAGSGPADGSIRLSVTADNDAPSVVTTGGSATYTENAATGVVIDPGLVLGDVDNAQLASATVSVTGGFAPGQDVLGFVNDGGSMGNITASYDAGTGVLSLNSAGASASLAQWQSALRAVTFANQSENPATTTRTISFAATDGMATASATRTVALTTVNDAPTTDPAHGYVNTGVSVEAGGSATITAAMLHEGDPDDHGTGVTYTVTTAAQDGTLFRDGNGNGVLDGGESLDAGSTFTQDDVGQDRIKYLHGGGSGTSDLLVLTVADGGEDGAAALTGVQFGITVSARPVLATGGGAPVYSEDGAAPAVAPNLVITDADSGAMAGATLRITDLANGDVLAFSNQNGITGSYDSATGTLTLSGTATTAEYEAALRSVTFASSSDNPATGAGNTDRVIQISVTDGALASSPQHITVSVANSNDAPVLDATQSPTLVAIAEDLAAPLNGSTANTTLVSTLLGGAADPDSGALHGIAITGVSAQGRLWYSTDGGGSWAEATALTGSNALLLPSDARVYFQPNSNVSGLVADALSFRAWDRSHGSAGSTADASLNGASSPFSAAMDTISVTIAAINDAPAVPHAASQPLAPVTEDSAGAGTTVASILSALGASDADGGAPIGMAVEAIAASRGQWQYSTDDGATWHGFGAVSSSAALLLGATSLVRYQPDLENGETGAHAPRFDLRAWDQSAGTPSNGAVRSTADLGATGGGTPFSSATASVKIDVTAVNDAPTLSATPHPLAGTDEETASATTTVAALLAGGAGADKDIGALQGAALTGASGIGSWQYSLDGTNWQDVGAVSDGAALVLAASALLRFKPDGMQGGAATLSYRAWDQSDVASGGTRVDATVTGGSSAFSAATATVSMAVADVNDAPVNVIPAAQGRTADSKLVFSQANANAISITDVDAGSAVLQATLTASHGTLSLSGTAGLSFIAGDGTADALITVSGTLAALNAALDGLEFTPQAGYVGAAGLQLAVTDNGNTGSGGALVDTDSVAIDYTAPPPPPSSGTPSTTVVIDGVTVDRQTLTNSDGSVRVVLSVPVVQPTRSEQIGNNTVADIALVTSDGASLLTAQVPVGFGLTAAGGATPKAAGASLSDLIREIKAHTVRGSQDQDALTGGGSGFVQALPTDSPLMVQTIVPTAASGTVAAAAPLVLTGMAPGSGKPTTALVIDSSGLPSGSVIQLQHVEFAAIIGAVGVTGGEGAQHVWGDGSSQYIMLGAGDDVLHGGAGDDTVGSAGGNDQIFGDEGNDLVFGGEGTDLIDGGSGIDTARLSGSGRADYAIRVENGRLVFTHLHGGADGVDTLANVEQLNFAGATPDLGASGTIARMYDALFGRAPDLQGLEHWVGTQAAGLSMQDIARQLIGSQEAAPLAGAGTDARFVDSLYQGSLGRQAHASEQAYWLDLLAQGRATRADLVVAFADSPEKLALEQAQGLTLDVGRTDVATLVRAYQVLFDRQADAAGLNHWIAASESGMGMREIASSFLQGPEAATLLGGMSNAQFVDYLYRTGLDRQGSLGEVAAWTGHLDSGALSRGDVVLAFADSAEMIELVGVMSTSIITS